MTTHPVTGKRGGAMLLWILGAALACGAEEFYRPPTTILFTPVFRIRIEASSAPAGMVYSTWADPVLQRLYKVLQWEVRPFPDRTLTLRQYPAAAGQGGDLSAEQPAAGQVEQILAVFGTAGDQRAYLEELLVEAALERQVIDRMSPAARSRGIPAVPRWMSVGLARYLNPELRTRDVRWVGDSIEAGVWPGVAEWVTWRNLPVGYAEEKSFSCQAVAWMLSRPAGPQSVLGCLDHLAKGRQIDLGQVALGLGFASASEAEADWRSWLERQGRMVRFGVDRPRDLAARLRAQMTFSNDELTRAGVPPNVEPTWAGLVEARGKPWLRKLTARKADALRLMAIGKDQEFRDWVLAATLYLEACGESRFWPLSITLRRRYADLERRLRQYEQAVIQRETYLDTVEAAGLEAPLPVYEPGLEKSALRDYVDRVESNLTGGAARSP